MKKNQKILKTSASGVALAGTSFMLGFSLIELLVVVAIIGILAAIGMVGYGRYTETAKRGAVEANARAIASALTVADTTKTCVDQTKITGANSSEAFECAKKIWKNANMANPYNQSADEANILAGDASCSEGPGKIIIGSVSPTDGNMIITACELQGDATADSDATAEESPVSIKVTNFK